MKGYTVAKKDAPVEETVTEAPAKAVKAPINPQVPTEYKNEKTGTYRPGQDARHASDVAKRIVAGEDESKALAELGSDKLREKAVKQAANAREKVGTTGTPGFVLIKKTEFEARKLRGDGGVNVDGDKGWEHYDADSAVAKTFESVKDREASRAEAENAGMAE